MCKMYLSFPLNTTSPPQIVKRELDVKDNRVFAVDKTILCPELHAEPTYIIRNTISYFLHSSRGRLLDIFSFPNTLSMYAKRSAYSRGEELIEGCIKW